MHRSGQEGRIVFKKEKKLLGEWMLRHELLASCGITVIIGLLFGAAATGLEWLLV